MQEQTNAELSEAFWLSFRARHEALSAEVKEAKTAEEVTRLRGLVSELQEDTTRAAAYIPAYDLGQSQKRLNELVVAVEERRQTLTPKRKFAFKRNTSAPKIVAAAQPSVAAASSNDASPAPVTREGLYLTGLGEVGGGESGRDVVLTDLRGCVVDLGDAPLASLHLRRVERCVIRAVAVSGSVMVFESSESILLLSAQQLRMHTSVHIDVYVEGRSGPIIEGCREMRFAPLPRVAGSEIRDEGMWGRVEDFGWLQRSIPSPHWSILPEEERWDGYIPGDLVPAAIPALLARVLPPKSG